MLTIWHIGGDGPVGPAEAILKRHKQAHLITFDAREAVGMPVCFSDKCGEADFYITRNPMASSLLRRAQAAADEEVLWDEGNGTTRVDRWRDLTEVERIERVMTTTVDEYANGSAPQVLSLDVQGAEAAVLRGAEKTLPKVLCVITEVEFWPIYEGQGLLDEQMAILKRHGFRLVRMYNPQEWHPGTPAGQGFLTVAEAVWLRYEGWEELGLADLCNLTLIAACYDCASYAQKLWNLAQRRSIQAAA